MQKQPKTPPHPPHPTHTHTHFLTLNRNSQTNANPRQSNIIGTNNSMYNVESAYAPKLFILKQQRQSLMSDDEEFNQAIQVSSVLAWGLLFLNGLFAAFVPCWIMWDIHSESFTRIAWRFTTLTVLLVPFVMYQQRNVKSQSEKFVNCLIKEKIRPIFICSINLCIWILLFIYSSRWTSLNHAMCFTDLKILVTCLFKFKNGRKFHQFQVGGAMIAIIGIILILSDSIFLPHVSHSNSDPYLQISPWKRLLLGDGLAILGSFASYYLDRYFSKPEMPRFTYLFIYYFFLTFNLITFGYFFGGSQFSFDTKFGVFGLFTYTNFVNVFYVSVMLGLMLIMTNIFVRQIFSELIINIAGRFQMVETSIIYHLLGLERVPNGLTCLGYAFLVPGLVFILGGESTLENKENKLNFQLYRPLRNSKRQTLVIQNPSPTISGNNARKNMPFMDILEQEENMNQQSANFSQRKQ